MVPFLQSLFQIFKNWLKRISALTACVWGAAPCALPTADENAALFVYSSLKEHFLSSVASTLRVHTHTLHGSTRALTHFSAFFVDEFSFKSCSIYIYIYMHVSVVTIVPTVHDIISVARDIVHGALDFAFGN